MNTLPTQYANACYDNAVRNAISLQETQGRAYHVIGGVNELGVHWICANLNEDGSINEWSVVDGDNPLVEVQRVLTIEEATRVRNQLRRNGLVEPREALDGSRDRNCVLAPNPLEL